MESILFYSIYRLTDRLGLAAVRRPGVPARHVPQPRLHAPPDAEHAGGAFVLFGDGWSGDWPCLPSRLHACMPS